MRSLPSLFAECVFTISAEALSPEHLEPIRAFKEEECRTSRKNNATGRPTTVQPPRPRSASGASEQMEPTWSFRLGMRSRPAQSDQAVRSRDRSNSMILLASWRAG